MEHLHRCRRSLLKITVFTTTVITSCLAHGAEPAAKAGALSDRLMARDALVYDRKTDLTWQRCALGQQWQEAKADRAGSCVGQPVRLTFDAAKRLEAKGWRIPKLDELVSIVVTGASPTVDSLAFPNTPATYFWATDNRDKGAAWYVSFEDGRTNHYFPPRTNVDVVRFVRTGPWSRDTGPRASTP